MSSLCFRPFAVARTATLGCLLAALTLSLSRLGAGESPAPAPAPAPDATPAPKPAPGPQAGAAPAPAPPSAPPPPPIVPADLPPGQAHVRFFMMPDLRVTRLMVFQHHLYGYDGPRRIDFNLDEVSGFESNERCEVQMKGGALPIVATQQILRDTRYYFCLDDDSQMLAPESRVLGLYPPDRFKIYPDVFHKYVSTWGTVYDQRPFYIQLDLGYVQVQGAQRTQLATEHLLTGSDYELWRISLESNAAYGSTDSITTTSNAGADLKASRYLANLLYGYAKSGIFHDDINEVRYRWTDGVGIGIGTFEEHGIFGQLLGTPISSHKLDLEFGFDRIDERDSTSSTTGYFGRAALMDRLHVSDTVDFDNTFQYQPGLDETNRTDRGQYFLHYQGELRMKLVKAIALRVAYNFDYNSRPPDGVPPGTNQLSVNLSFAFGQ
ncbi:MAG: DUF481 domain-containing protein [Planctomycetota bacterium]